MSDRRGGSILLWAVTLKLAVAVLLIAVAGNYPAVDGLTSPREGDTPTAIWYLARGFDSNAYQRMAREGWYDDFSIGVPMGYPLAIRALLPLTGSAQTAAFVVSNACSLAALLVFIALARRYTGSGGERVNQATLLCACLPGWLAFGTVAYSEGPWILLTLAAWWAWLKSEVPAGAGDSRPATVPRSVGWLLLAAVLAALSVQVRHAGVAFVGGLLLVEGWRVLSAGAGRGRALIEAALVAVVAALPTAAYLAFKFGVQDMGGAQQALFGTSFVPFGGLVSLLRSGAPPENVALIYLSFPLALALLARLWSVDRRLALVTGVQLLLAVSITGIGAQSLNRLVWALEPLALGALAIRDRVLLGGVCGVLVLVSAWCGIGHVLGTAAL